MPVIDKAKIIEAIQQTDDEKVLSAINWLLKIEQEDIPDWHREIVEQRWKDMDEGRAAFHDWEKVKEEIKWRN